MPAVSIKIKSGENPYTAKRLFERCATGEHEPKFYGPPGIGIATVIAANFLNNADAIRTFETLSACPDVGKRDFKIHFD